MRGAGHPRVEVWVRVSGKVGRTLRSRVKLRTKQTRVSVLRSKGRSHTGKCAQDTVKKELLKNGSKF